MWRMKEGTDRGRMEEEEEVVIELKSRLESRVAFTPAWRLFHFYFFFHREKREKREKEESVATARGLPSLFKKRTAPP